MKCPDGTPKSRGNAFDISARPGDLARAMRDSAAKADAGRVGAQRQMEKVRTPGEPCPGKPIECWGHRCQISGRCVGSAQ